jgi:hypothetical protein
MWAVCVASLCTLVACGGGSPKVQQTPPPPATITPPAPTKAVEEDTAKHDEIIAAHRKIEEEQQTALALTCSEADRKTVKPRCLPSCYTPAPPDPRAGKKLAGSVEIQHLACQESGAYIVIDELDAKLQARPLRGRAPKPHKKGTWQADIETALTADAVIVTGTWRQLTHPLTKETLRCVTVSHYTTIRRPLDACGGTGDVVCEAGGNPATHGLDVVHYRLEEARRLLGAHDSAGCLQAALEAVAVARGLPRWRQYAKLNVEHWPKAARFRTRFDGMVDEDSLFAIASTLRGHAEATYASCGGDASAPTTPDQEQSFHTCW